MKRKLLLFTDSMYHRLIFDRTVCVKQLNVVEAHGILLMKADKGRDAKVDKILSQLHYLTEYP